MLVVELVGDGSDLTIERSPAIRFVAPDQEDRVAERVEDEKHVNVASAWPTLLHVGMARSFDEIDKRSAKSWTTYFEDFNVGYPAEDDSSHAIGPAKG